MSQKVSLVITTNKLMCLLPDFSSIKTIIYYHFHRVTQTVLKLLFHMVSGTVLLYWFYCASFFIPVVFDLWSSEPL